MSDKVSLVLPTKKRGEMEKKSLLKKQKEKV